MLARTIHTGEYGNPSVTVRVWQAILERIQNQADEAGINNDFPEFGAEIIKKAIMAGYAEEDVSALFKVL
jgi:3-hydroxyisobutyrate dehydrogenase-like beta-hydroxyacid dehydrogenase